MTEDTSSWQSAARAAEECQYLNQLYDKEDLKVIFLTEAKCKIRFISVKNTTFKSSYNWFKNWLSSAAPAAD